MSQAPVTSGSLLMRVQGKLYDSRLLHMFAVAMAPAGFIAVLAIFNVVEFGRVD